jgi:hypothetical protein
MVEAQGIKKIAIFKLFELRKIGTVFLIAAHISK